ncbi:flagellar motor protein MotA [Marivirga tractuosa]|uniref:MotA/TolQ/ExbB proton channel n=1 Tax=Marivirga tractuosa (strain ATCC 23168 / DSM 4126 / NBRC 15989 / NCIMB 1408 / VKM B-1430 / H-43) TaxID=643867 RepID=E4TQQ9_MARTH|nr:MotA/TolQ/ExbB proton channel family protein [Marivirga tractuosa]ADR20620.1 MotA/TolQ/ExbB proton channel [Marivirga tractuosa DSM 4126]BDD14930.1 flagellar motor protein MotA [Marivirga tractuosa]
MKKLFVLMMMAGALAFGFNGNAIAQDQEEATSEMENDTTAMESDSASADADSAAMEESEVDTTATAVVEEEEVVEEQGFHQIVKEKFIEGGWEFMSVVLICLILGLAISIERIITLNLATTNTNKLLANVEDALNQGGVEAAKEVTKNTRGPVASIFTQGLMRMSEGVEMVEKSVISYGSVEMGRLERGLVWISLFISLAPMLGFMGTVIGMIGAFDAIEEAGDISPSLVAGGIKVALLTTVGGLIVAVILQLFYNYCVSKVDSLVNQMEDASIALVDILVKHNLTK